MSTITARFITVEKYLERYTTGYNTPHYITIAEDEYPYARGVEVSFGSAVIAHWMVTNAYFDEFAGDLEEIEQRRTEVLDGIVGAAFKRLLGDKLAESEGESDLAKMFSGR